MASTTVAGAMPGLIPDSERLVVEGVAYSKVTWRLLPFLFACYVFAYLDRVNVGFAKLQMLNDLKTGDKVVTSGGLRGTVIALRDDYIQLRVPPDNLRLEVTRASVASVVAPEDKNSKAA